MNDMRNPYIAGAPVVETSMFFGRGDVFKWIQNSLTGKYVDHILVLHGQRRVGKTTVLKQIPNFLSEEYVQVFFDLQGRTNTTLDRFLWWMASEITRTLNKALDINLPRISRDQFTDPDVFITDFIPNLHPVLGDQILLLTFDEFDTLAREDIQEQLARPLINFLRRLFDVDGLNFIFSIGSSGNKLENMRAAYTNFFKSALYRKVSFLTKDNCIDLITKPVAGVITYHPKAVQRIIEMTSGHPYFTQLTCHELFSQCQSTGSLQVSVEDVENILDDVIERGTVNLKFVWDEASDLEKWILAVLGMDEGLNQKKIAQVLKSHGVHFSDSDLNTAVLHLRDKDVLTKDNHLVIHLMKLWLELNRPMDRVREELVQTNPIADRYIEIGDEYRDRGQQEQALSSYQQALSAQANNITALLNMGAIYTNQENYQLAGSSFEKALQVDSENIAARQGFCQAHLVIGDQAKKTDRINDAIEAYQTILNLTPVHAEARGRLADIYCEQAEAYLSSGSDQQALEQLQLAMEMAPEDEDLKARYQQILDQKKAALVKSWMDKAERSLRRQRWDEAASLADEALKIDPENKTLELRVAEIKDAPRQQKLIAYQREAETALSKGDYSKAIEALEKAALLAPEDEKLQEKFAVIQEDHLNARLQLFTTQAEEAQSAGRWEDAIAARKAALKLDPDNKSLIKAVADTQAAQHQARLDALFEKVNIARRKNRWDEALQAVESLIDLAPEDNSLQTLVDEIRTDQHEAILEDLQERLTLAKQAGQWDEAIQAAEALIKLAPEDVSLQIQIDELKTSRRQARLDDLQSNAQTAMKGEQWQAAVSALEIYLDEAPEETDKYEAELAKARKYAQVSADYQNAQEMIRKKQFNKAIPLLQGIIAQDPTYKSTSRLLVEVVEARGERKPIWRKPWLYAAFVVAVIAVFGFVFSGQITGWINTLQQKTSISSVETEEENRTSTPSDVAGIEEPTISPEVTEVSPVDPIESQGAQATLTPEEIIEQISTYVASEPATFEDDFSVYNPVWGDLTVGEEITNTPAQDLISDGKLSLRTYNRTLIPFSTPNPLTAKNFVLEFELNEEPPVEGSVSYNLSEIDGYDPEDNCVGFQIRSKYGDDFDDGEYYSFCFIRFNRNWVIRKDTSSYFTIIATDTFWEEGMTLRIIAYSNIFAVYIDDELITIFQDEEIMGDGNYILADDAYIVVDNLRFWNLDQVAEDDLFGTATGETSIEPTAVVDEESERANALYKTAVNYMAETPATFEDDFEVANSNWGSMSITPPGQMNGTASFYNYFKNGQLQFPADVGDIYYGDPRPNFEAENFIFSYSFSPQAGFSSLSMVFRQLERESLWGYEIYIYDGEVIVGIGQNKIHAYMEAFDPSQWYNLLVVAVNEVVGVYIDGELITYDEDLAQDRIYNDPLLSVKSLYNDEDLIFIDNFGFWNLDGVDFDALLETAAEETTNEPKTTPTSQGSLEAEPYMTNFVNPILDNIADRSPDFADDFSSGNTADWYMPDWTFNSNEIVDNEIKILGTLENQSIKFYDYVVEVDVKPNNYNKCGFFLSNGSAVEFEFTIIRSGGWELSEVHGAYENHGSMASGSEYRLTVISKGSQLAFLIDSEVVEYIDFTNWRLYRGNVPIVGLKSEDGYTYFDNFMVWNITSFDLPTD